MKLYHIHSIYHHSMTSEDKYIYSRNYCYADIAKVIGI